MLPGQCDLVFPVERFRILTEGIGQWTERGQWRRWCSRRRLRHRNFRKLEHIRAVVDVGEQFLVIVKRWGVVHEGGGPQLPVYIPIHHRGTARHRRSLNVTKFRRYNTKHNKYYNGIFLVSLHFDFFRFYIQTLFSHVTFTLYDATRCSCIIVYFRFADFVLYALSRVIP